MAIIVFYGATLRGGFVYDDTRQIVRNPLVQDPGLLGRALVSDVWAFKGGGEAVSDYWRPTFVLWIAANARLFGLGSTTGWHAANILLHAGVTALGFALLRRWGLSPLLAGAVALLFAVHPAHAESVAWISGAPDLLMSLALLATLWFADALPERATAGTWAAALFSFALGLGAKEASFLFPVVVFVALRRPRGGRKSAPTAWRAAVLASPFLLLSGLFFLSRWGVIGRLSRPVLGGATFADAVLTAPAALFFYLRQTLVPLLVGPSYPLRAVTPATVSFGNFWAPLLAVAAAGFVLARLAKRTSTGAAGLALCVVPLLPALSIQAFAPEFVVHDRYLYLPLLGFLLVLWPAFAADGPLATPAGGRRERILFGAAAAGSLVLGVQTLRAASAYASNLAFTEAAVRSDPTSAPNWDFRADALVAAGRLPEAADAFSRALSIQPLATSVVGRSRLFIETGRFAEAERDLVALVDGRALPASPYVTYQAFESLAICYERQKRWDEAVRVLETGIARLPFSRAALTEKLAVVLYQAGRKDRALAELEGVRTRAAEELLPEAKAVLFRLGLLYAEAGRNSDARLALADFLAQTTAFGDAGTLRDRETAARVLAQLPR
ncbi:MAG: tetratricopeptide repeat protein [Acidobacteria bacterium]|nr:tetratricopeptide repeat protein [Acidobacteriota bacterium]